MNEPQPKNYATWDISLDAHCPHCKEWVDLLETPDFWGSRSFGPIEHGTRRTENVEVHCPSCNADFIVDFEY